MLNRVKSRNHFMWILVIICLLLSAHSMVWYSSSIVSQIDMVDREISATANKIRYLEAEFETRTSQMQLEKWNELEYGYITPNAGQFVDDNSQLDDLIEQKPWVKPIRVVTMQIDGEIIAPAGEIRQAEAYAKQADGKDAQLQIDNRKASTKSAITASVNPSIEDKSPKAKDKHDLLDRRLLNQIRLRASVESLGGEI